MEIREIIWNDPIPNDLLTAYTAAFSAPPWGETYGWKVYDALRDANRENRLYAFSVTESGKQQIIGGAVFRRLDRSNIFETFLPRNPGAAWLQEFFITPDYQKRGGYGKKGLALILQEIARAGFTSVASRTHPLCPKMIHLFGEYGFDQIGANTAETGGVVNPRVYFLNTRLSTTSF